MAELYFVSTLQKNWTRCGLDLSMLCTGQDIREKYRELFNGVGLLKDYEMKPNIDDFVQAVAQPVRRIPFGVKEN